VYLVSERLRTGLAVHSPTFYEFKDNWGSNMKGHFVDSTSQLNENEQPTGEYKYKLRTPTKITASLAYIFGTKGCVNVDVDYIDYRHAHFRSTSDINFASYSYESENLFAKEAFRNTVNIRIGGEYLVNNHFVVRAGLARYGKAFTNEQEAELTADWITSCGFGIRIRNASIDMSYRRLIQTRNYYAFSGSTTETNDQNHRITLSLNFLF
jgi:long-subunit fatty acid transport protein